jgi:putative FmdB family regulatory protein
MPLYEYRCDSCEHQFEVIQRFSDDPIAICPSCGGGPVAKLLSSPAIQFKGSGWYITDYARKGQGSGEGTSAAKDKDAAGAASSDTKSTPAAAPSTSPSTSSSAKE